MKEVHLAKRTRRSNERGSVLAYTVLSVLFLFLAVGLGADLSHLYLVKTELQNGADAAALAGASALLLPEDVRIGTAVDRAVATMNKNRYNFNNKQFANVMTPAEQRSLVQFAVNLDGDYVNEETAAGMKNIRFVRVQTPSVRVNIFFSIPVLGLERTMNTTATAGLSHWSNVFCNYIPIAVIEGAFGEGVGWLDANGDGKREYATDCTPPPGSKDCNPNIRFCTGCKYKMVAGPGAWQDTSPGNFQALDAGSGANDLKLAIAGGTSNCITADDHAVFITETEPGRMTGPIEKGLNTRFDDYQAFGGGGTVSIGGVVKSIEEAFPPDPNIFENAPKNKNAPYSGIDYNVYKKATKDPPVNWLSPNPTHVPADHRREILMPIINQSEFQSGKDTVKFTWFGKFFMNRSVGGIPSSPEIYVEFLEPAFGSGGFDPVGGPAAPVVVPVLYR